MTTRVITVRITSHDPLNCPDCVQTAAPCPKAAPRLLTFKQRLLLAMAPLTRITTRRTN